MIYNISAFLCLEMAEAMVYILLICILGLSEMFPDNVQTQKSCKKKSCTCKLLKGCLIWWPFVITFSKHPLQVLESDQN